MREMSLPTRLMIAGHDRARRAYERAAGPPPSRTLETDHALSGQAASDAIKARLLSGAPTMVGRLGAVELACLENHRAIHRRATIGRSADYVRGRSRAFWGWEDGILADLRQNAGFFPTDPDSLERFAQLMLDDMPCVDILGSWLRAERQFASHLQGAVKVRLRDLEPYYQRDPWTEALAGRSVLVVHPFAETITSQYMRREQLFADRRVLPDFELKTIAAVQSVAGSETGFATWFEAFERMRDQIDETSFDVALIGCGAYGFPLAAHVKRLGKAAVHIGGAVQILFGIKGKRWDDHPEISALYNEHWVRPDPSERPATYLAIEDGCYW